MRRVSSLNRMPVGDTPPALERWTSSAPGPTSRLNEDKKEEKRVATVTLPDGIPTMTIRVA